MIHCPKLGWAPVTGRISRLFTLSPNLSPPLLGVTRCLLDRVQGLCPCVPQGQSVGKSSCGGDEGSQELRNGAVLGDVCRTDPGERPLLPSSHSLSPDPQREAHTEMHCVNSTAHTTVPRPVRGLLETDLLSSSVFFRCSSEEWTGLFYKGTGEQVLLALKSICLRGSVLQL